MTVAFAAIIVVPRVWPHIDILTVSMLGGYATFLRLPAARLAASIASATGCSSRPSASPISSSPISSSSRARG